MCLGPYIDPCGIPVLHPNDDIIGILCFQHMMVVPVIHVSMMVYVIMPTMLLYVTVKEDSVD